MKILKTVFLLFLISAYSQDSDFPQLTEEEIDYGKLVRTEYYNGESLWGLINGGADIYLEYGFDKMVIQEIETKDDIFRIEIYRMKNHEAAFGIYSINRYKCDLSDSLTKYICITDYQVQGAVGRFYISIANEKGKESSKTYNLNLFEKILEKINELPFHLPEHFDNERYAKYVKELKLISGPLGIQNSYPDWQRYFDNYDNYRAFLLKVISGDDMFYIAQIKFGSPEEKERFVIENVRETNTFRLLENISPVEIVVIDADVNNDILEKISID